MTERRYAMKKVAPGDYLFRAGGENVWRVARYEETDDGPVPISDWPRDEETWGVWQWEGLSTRYGPVVDADSWEKWIFRGGLFPTRRDAVAALPEIETLYGHFPCREHSIAGPRPRRTK